MREGATAARMRHLSELVGVNRRTIERWREWWRDTFTASPFWRIGRATFMPTLRVEGVGDDLDFPHRGVSPVGEMLQGSFEPFQRFSASLMGNEKANR